MYRKNSLTLGSKELNLLIAKGGVTVRSTTIRISEKKRDTLKIIASIEKREMKEILSELIDEYIERHKETLELLSERMIFGGLGSRIL